MNDDIELTQDERLRDLAQAYVELRSTTLGTGAVDPEKAKALAQLSMAMSLLERDAYAEGEYEEDEDEEDQEEV